MSEVENQTQRSDKDEPKLAPESETELLEIFAAESMDQLRQRLVQQDFGTSYEQIYSNRKLRKIDDLRIRTVGRYDAGVGAYKGVFVDERRGRLVDSELNEFLKKCEDYRVSQSDTDLIEVCLEATDVMFPLLGLQYRQDDNREIIEFAEQTFGIIFELIIKPKLAELGIDFVLVQRLGRIKYAVRGNLQNAGYVGKHPALEEALCLEELNAWRSMDVAKKPEEIASTLGYESVEQMSRELLEDERFSLPSLVDRKYGKPLSNERLIRPDMRPIRRLQGPGSVSVRLFGVSDGMNPGTQYEEQPGKFKDTDWKQYQDAKLALESVLFDAFDAGYDLEDRGRASIEEIHQKKIGFLKRAASFIWQRQVVEQLHTDSYEKDAIKTSIGLWMFQVRQDLQRLLYIDIEELEMVTRLIFGVRVLAEKQPILEDELLSNLITRSFAPPTLGPLAGSKDI